MRRAVVLAAACLAAAPTADAALPRAKQIHVPSGFRAETFARGLESPTAIAFGPDGQLWATEQGGRIVSVKPGSGRPKQRAAGLTMPLGLVWFRRTLFVSTEGSVVRFRYRKGRLRGRTVIVSGLPSGQHQQNHIALGPDGRLYLGSGSTCDACLETDPLAATILSFRRDGGGLRVVATGVRNAFGLGFEPQSGDLYATINAVNRVPGVSDARPAELLVRVTEGADFGWPGCWPSWPDRILVGDCDGVTEPVAYLEEHSSADGLAFNRSRAFPLRYRRGVFVALWGQFGRFDHGRRVEFVSLPSGEPERFATGFAHPLALAVDRHGALLVADWQRGTIVRIQHGRLR
jgi:glucose/arabinose dehydrogenase